MFLNDKFYHLKMENLIRTDYNKEFHTIEVITFERVMKVPKNYNIYHINSPEFIPKRYNQGLCPGYKFIPEKNYKSCYDSPIHNYREGDFPFDFNPKGILNYKNCICGDFYFIRTEDVGDSNKCKCHIMKVNMECSGCVYNYLYKRTTYAFFMERNLNFLIQQYNEDLTLRDANKVLEKGIYLTLEDKELKYFRSLRNDTIRYSLLYLNHFKHNNEIYQKIFNNLIWFMGYNLYLYKLECINTEEACLCINRIRPYKFYIPFEPNEPIFTLIIKSRNEMFILHNLKY